MKLSLQNKTNAVNRKKRFFIPTDIGVSCVGWWDFTDGKYIFSGDGTVPIVKDAGIRRIKNKAKELGKTTTPLGEYLDNDTADKQPLWKEAGELHRKFYAAFDGTNDFLLANQSIGNVATDVLANTVLDHDAFTMFAVFSPDTANVSGDQQIFQMINNNSSAIGLRIDADTADTINFENANGVSRNTNQTNPPRGSSGVTNTAAMQWWTALSNGDHNTATGDLYKNGNTGVGVGDIEGTDGDMLLSSDHATNLILMGAKTTTGNFYDGKIHEIIVFDALLAAHEIALVETYIKSKYGKMD